MTKDYSKIAKELRKHILDTNDFEVEEVKVPEWNLPFSIYVRAMSAKERDNFESRQIVDDNKGNRTLSLENLRASLLVEVICADPEGKHNVFTGKEDVIALGKKSAAALDRCLETARRLNKSTEEDEEALVKNSKGQAEGSG